MNYYITFHPSWWVSFVSMWFISASCFLSFHLTQTLRMHCGPSQPSHSWFFMSGMFHCHLLWGMPCCTFDHLFLLLVLSNLAKQLRWDGGVDIYLSSYNWQCSARLLCASRVKGEVSKKFFPIVSSYFILLWIQETIAHSTSLTSSSLFSLIAGWLPGSYPSAFA